MTAEDELLLTAESVERSFVMRRSWGRPVRRVQALAGVDLAIRRGAALAVVGESGCGKSTLARCLTLFDEPDSGSISYRGEDLRGLPASARPALRRRLQLVFQDPAGALNPRFTAGEIVAEPLRVTGEESSADTRQRARAAMRRVGLLARWADRRPAELSGGQRQRLAIARALVCEPELLVLDEALAALDFSVQARIVNLVNDLRAQESLATVVISHDLTAIPHLAEEVAVMQAGRIVERGSVRRVLAAPRHPHTRALIAATSGLADA